MNAALLLVIGWLAIVVAFTRRRVRSGRVAFPVAAPAEVRRGAPGTTSFRCRFRVRRPRDIVTSGVLGHCVITNDGQLAVQFWRGTFAVATRGSSTVELTERRWLDRRLRITGPNLDVDIYPYEWDEAEPLLRSSGWLPTQPTGT